jgi:hypothetical protein
VWHTVYFQCNFYQGIIVWIMIFNLSTQPEFSYRWLENSLESFGMEFFGLRIRRCLWMGNLFYLQHHNLKCCWYAVSSHLSRRTTQTLDQSRSKLCQIYQLITDDIRSCHLSAWEWGFHHHAESIYPHPDVTLVGLNLCTPLLDTQFSLLECTAKMLWSMWLGSLGQTCNLISFIIFTN